MALPASHPHPSPHPPTGIGVPRAVGQREEALEWGTLVVGPGSGSGSLSQMVSASFASNLNPRIWARAFSLVVLGYSHPLLSLLGMKGALGFIYL